MRNMLFIAAGMTAALTLTSSQLAAQSAGPQASTMARNCFTCHGTGGHPVNGLAPLAGVEAKGIETALLDFKGDRRAATIMNRIAKGFSDEQIKALADYLSKQK